MENYLLAEPVANTFDMGLEFEFITEKGAGTDLGYFAEWPAYKIQINKGTVLRIKEKISNNSLLKEDLKESGLYSFTEEIDFADKDISLSEFLEDLINLKTISNDYIYCLRNPVFEDEFCPEFYSNKNDLLNEFKNKYTSNIVLWPEMDSAEKEYWEERKKEIKSFYFTVYK